MQSTQRMRHSLLRNENRIGADTRSSDGIVRRHNACQGCFLNFVREVANANINDRAQAISSPAASRDTLANAGSSRREPVHPPNNGSDSASILWNTEPPNFHYVEWPPSDWHTKTYSILDGYKYTLKNAVIHGSLGIITIDDIIVSELLHFALPEFHGFIASNDRQTLEMPAYQPADHFLTATHALCGYVGNRNYAHWWVDIMPAVGIAAAQQTPDTIVLPEIMFDYQRQCLALFQNLQKRSVNVSQGSSICVEQLAYIPRLSASDYTPDPYRRSMLERVKYLVGASNYEAHRKIYLSRKTPMRDH